MLIMTLILLQSTSRIVREHTFNLIEAFMSLKKEAQILDVFTETAKPKSAKKSDKEDFTPVK